MIKKIPIERLAPGMYIHDANGAWQGLPFLRNRDYLATDEDVRRLRRAGIRELYIDEARGKEAADAPTATEVRQATRLQLEAAAQERQAPAGVALLAERPRAERIRSEADRVISDLMRDVRMGRQVELERVEHAVRPMVSSIFRNRDALLGLTRIRHMDKYTFEHSVSVAVLLISFARQMDLDRESIAKIGTGALLHDIGKVRTPDHILNKPGRLTDEEYTVMRRHVVHSREILEQSRGIDPVSLAVAAEHHERYDGSGYPEGKQGREISLYGQMASIVDVYDAITATRVYRRGVEPHEVLRRLVEWSKFHFEPVLVQRFVQCVGIYPAGTLVSLASGRIAVVLASGSRGLLYPLVRVVYDTRRKSPVSPFDLDLSDLPPDSDERIVGAEAHGAWGIDPERFI